MPNNWKKYKLGDLINTNLRSLRIGEIDWINYFDIQSVGTGTYEKPKKINMSDAPSRARRIIKNGDTVISSVRPNLKSFFYCNNLPQNSVASTGFVILTAREHIDPRFLYYHTTNDAYIDYLVKSCTGSAYPAFNQNVINESVISLPPLQEQQAIAEILSALDDKIELNLQMNKTLEEMANALYKEWFVDFGPFKNGKFVESELGMIPEGWEVVNIGDYVETSGGGTPSTTVNEYWQEGDINWYSPTDLTKQNTLFSSFTEKKITKLGLAKSSAKILPEYSILMSSRATIGLITVNTTPSSTNQGFINLLPNDIFGLYQLIGWLKNNMDLIISKSNGSTFKEISKSNFRNLKILKGINIENFILQSSEIFNLIENNILETNTLKQTRDYLLPKLISGEIRVKEAQKKIKELV